MTARPPRNTSFFDLSRLLAGFTELGLSAASLRSRTIAVRAAGKWYNFATAVELLDAQPGTEQVVQLRNDVALVECTSLVDSSFSEDALRLSLSRWRNLLGAEQGFLFQSSVFLYRHYSDPRVGLAPGWRTDLTEQLSDRLSLQVPEGPFLTKQAQLFAADLPQLASGWLSGDRWASQSTLSHTYAIWIPDRRAFFRKMTAEGENLAVTIERHTEEALQCCVVATSFSGELRHFVADMTGTTAAFRFPFSVQSLDVWVTLDDGYALDHYHESPREVSWGAEMSLYNAPRRRSTELSAIADALSGGETSVVEFKPYVRLRRRDTKAEELLEVASAFANADGGDLYVGVTDYGEPVGIDRELHKEYDQDCSGDPQRVQDAYLRDLKKLFNEGLVPAVMPELHWHNIAQRLVLQIRFQAAEVAVSLIANGEVFRRVGATNRKIRPADLLRPLTER